MRCITPSEVAELFGKDGFSINSNPEFWRFALVLEHEIAKRQRRVGGRPTSDAGCLIEFAAELNRWLPTQRRRLLWLSHWFDEPLAAYELFVAARTGIGETRPLMEAPGQYFDAYDYENQDQVETTVEQRREVQLIVGFMSLVMINGWDGWFIAEGCTDGIEFWEGNLFFYSDDKSRLADAETLMTNFQCPRDLR